MLQACRGDGWSLREFLSSCKFLHTQFRRTG